MIRSKSKFINRETTDSERDSVDKTNVRVGRDLKITHFEKAGFRIDQENKDTKQRKTQCIV